MIRTHPPRYASGDDGCKKFVGTVLVSPVQIEVDAVMPPLSANDEEGNAMALQCTDQNSSGVEDQSTLATLSSLSHKITSYKAKLDEWAEKERRMADELVESYQAKLREEQSSIDTHVGDLLAVQLELGLNLQCGKENDQPTEAEEQQQRSIAARKLAMEKQHDDMTSEILKLQAEMNERGARIKGTLHVSGSCFVAMNLHFLERHMKHENTKYEYDFLWLTTIRNRFLMKKLKLKNPSI